MIVKRIAIIFFCIGVVVSLFEGDGIGLFNILWSLGILFAALLLLGKRVGFFRKLLVTLDGLGYLFAYSVVIAIISGYEFILGFDFFKMLGFELGFAFYAAMVAVGLGTLFSFISMFLRTNKKTDDIT